MPAKPLPNTGAVSGLKETLDFFGDPGFAQRRFETYGDVFATKLLAQPIVFIRGERAINDLFSQSESLEGWWPESVKKLLGSRSLANRSGAGHKARRRVVGQLFSSAALARYTPSIQQLVAELSQELISTNTPLPLAARMRRFAFAVIATTVLGLDSESREALFADLQLGEMRSLVPVIVTDDKRRIDAASMTVFDNGERILFGGTARMVMQTGKAGTAAN